ncbi:MAG: hypothetical protein ACI9HY_002109 [Planctomycetaceae bacterium]|jgi:hypothetical protein
MIMNLSLSISACGEDPERAVTLGERAVALNPYAPATFPAHLSLAYFVAARYVDVVNTIDNMARPVANGDLHRIATLVLMNETERAREAMASTLGARPYLNREIATASVMLAEGPDRKRYLVSLVEAGLP